MAYAGEQLSFDGVSKPTKTIKKVSVLSLAGQEKIRKRMAEERLGEPAVYEPGLGYVALKSNLITSTDSPEQILPPPAAWAGIL